MKSIFFVRLASVFTSVVLVNMLVYKVYMNKALTLLTCRFTRRKGQARWRVTTRELREKEREREREGERERVACGTDLW